MLCYHTIPYHTIRYRTRWIYVVLGILLGGKKKHLCNFLDLLGRVFLSPCPSLSAYWNRMLFKCR